MDDLWGCLRAPGRKWMPRSRTTSSFEACDPRWMVHMSQNIKRDTDIIRTNDNQRQSIHISYEYEQRTWHIKTHKIHIIKYVLHVQLLSRRRAQTSWWRKGLQSLDIGRLGPLYKTTFVWHHSCPFALPDWWHSWISQYWVSWISGQGAFHLL